jgi:hypothetical protein
MVDWLAICPFLHDNDVTCCFMQEGASQISELLSVNLGIGLSDILL